MLGKWKKAVVHLEAATDSVPRAALHTQHSEGALSFADYVREFADHSRDIREHGTSIFLIHQERHYLLTARHVVHDERAAKIDLDEESERLTTWPESMREELLRSAEVRAASRLFSLIFRVPTFDEVLASRTSNAVLMNLGAGASSSASYTFSEPDIDLALLSLGQTEQAFVRELYDRGYVPISSTDIAEGPEHEGEDVFTLGFPVATSVVGTIDLTKAEANWSSSAFSLPVASFGRVSMLHAELPFFWADLSVYPGNSGGPVVAGDRLVGVVSAQATSPVLDSNEQSANVGIPFARVIKAGFIWQLLKEQEEKDSSWRGSGSAGA